MRHALINPNTKQFARFAGVGLVSFAVDWVMLILMVECLHIDYLASTTVSFLTSVALNYALSMRFVFEHRDDMSRKREFTIFTVLSIIGLGLNDFFMFAGVAMLNIAYQAMKVIATFLVTWYNFFTRRHFLSGTQR